MISLLFSCYGGFSEIRGTSYRAYLLMFWIIPTALRGECVEVLTHVKWSMNKHLQATVISSTLDPESYFWKSSLCFEFVYGYVNTDSLGCSGATASATHRELNVPPCINHHSLTYWLHRNIFIIVELSGVSALKVLKYSPLCVCVCVCTLLVTSVWLSSRLEVCLRSMRWTAPSTPVFFSLRLDTLPKGLWDH